MSFASDTKSELCRSPMTRLCCLRAELYGILLYCNTFSGQELRILTEHRGFLQRAEKLLKRVCDVEPDQFLGENGGKLGLVLRDEGKLRQLCAIYGCEPDRSPALHVNLGVLEEDCCRISFLRGAFLAGGSVVSPQKSYHMELITSHSSVSRETGALLRELNFHPGSLSRNGNYVLYFKHSEAIEDLLTTLGAPVAAMEIMNTKVEKELVNRVNRRTNCDEANVEKTVIASQTQIAAIHRLRESGRLENLNPRLQQVALLREQNPELNLMQLAALSDPPLTKSCLNHRLRKIMELAENEEE